MWDRLSSSCWHFQQLLLHLQGAVLCVHHAEGRCFLLFHCWAQLMQVSSVAPHDVAARCCVPAPSRCCYAEGLPVYFRQGQEHLVQQALARLFGKGQTEGPAPASPTPVTKRMLRLQHLPHLVISASSSSAQVGVGARGPSCCSSSLFFSTSPYSSSMVTCFCQSRLSWACSIVTVFFKCSFSFSRGFADSVRK